MRVSGRERQRKRESKRRRVIEDERKMPKVVIIKK